MTAPQHPASVRIHWMDAVRGTAILLLLIWHASAVPVLYDQPMPEAIRTVNEFFLPYRMPTLMFLSGMLLARSMRKPLPAYYAGKFAMVVWPYMIWVLIARLTFNGEAQPPLWHWRSWYASSYLWFLFFIAVYYLVAPAFRRLPAWAPVALAVIAGLLLPSGTTEQKMAYFAIFFFAGNWLAQRPDALNLLTSRWTIPIMAVPVLGFGIASCIWPEQLHYVVWGAPASIAGAALLASCFSRLARHGNRARALQFLGKSSLIYYVSHFPIMALLSIWLVESVDPVLLTTINLVAAIAAGTAFSLMKKRLPIIWLFEAPTILTHAITRVLSPLDRPRRIPASPEPQRG